MIILCGTIMNGGRETQFDFVILFEIYSQLRYEQVLGLSVQSAVYSITGVIITMLPMRPMTGETPNLQRICLEKTYRLYTQSSLENVVSVGMLHFIHKYVTSVAIRGLCRGYSPSPPPQKKNQQQQQSAGIRIIRRGKARK